MNKFINTYLFVHCLLTRLLTIPFNPLQLLFKALLWGQTDRVFFSRHLIYILQQERFRAFRPAGDI
jgi:hypothetical protein